MKWIDPEERAPVRIAEVHFEDVDLSLAGARNLDDLWRCIIAGRRRTTVAWP
jgi:hypothetical protein